MQTVDLSNLNTNFQPMMVNIDDLQNLRGVGPPSRDLLNLGHYLPNRLLLNLDSNVNNIDFTNLNVQAPPRGGSPSPARSASGSPQRS